MRDARTAVPPLATGLVGAGCAVVAGATLGRTGVVSALLATAVVLSFLWSGRVPLVIARVVPDAAGLAFLVLMINYVLRLLLALVLLAAATRAGVADGGAVGLTLIACALTWTTAQVAVLTRRSGTE